MADASTIEVKVSIDRAMHERLTAFAQEMAQEYGVQIRRVSFDWMEVAQVGGSTAYVQAVDIDSRALAAWKKAT